MMHVRAWRPAVLAAVIPALVCSAAPAFAQDAPGVHRIEVHYGDLDLTTAKGRTVLERRLRYSAAAVCDYDPFERLNRGGGEEQACYALALAHARVSLAAAISKTRMASGQ